MESAGQSVDLWEAGDGDKPVVDWEEVADVVAAEELFV